MVHEGDTVVSLAGKSIESPQEALFGLVNSIGLVTILSTATGKPWDVEIRRHIPLHTWVAWHGSGGVWKGLLHISAMQKAEFEQVHFSSLCCVACVVFPDYVEYVYAYMCACVRACVCVCVCVRV
jgi:hypothetical protein